MPLDAHHPPKSACRLRGKVWAWNQNSPDPDLSVRDGSQSRVLSTWVHLLCLNQCLRGFYGSENLHMNSKTQRFPPELIPPVADLFTIHAQSQSRIKTGNSWGKCTLSHVPTTLRWDRLTETSSYVKQCENPFRGRRLCPACLRYSHISLYCDSISL